MDADVAIVGAGPAGAAAALYLARQGRSVLVFDRRSLPGDKPCGEGLMPRGSRVLAELGLLAPLRARGAPLINGVAFSAGGSGEAFSPFPYEPGIGVRRSILEALLVERLRAQPLIDLRDSCAVTAIDYETLTLSAHNRRVSARALIVADGLRSPLRKAPGWAGRPRSRHRYAMVGHVSTATSPEPWIRVDIRGGYEVFSAPSGDRERLVAVLGGKHIFDGPRGIGLEALYRQLSSAAGALTAPVLATGPFDVFPARLAQGGTFLVGDAAGFLDPVTGQGIETALVSARAVSNVIGRMLDGELDQCQAADRYAAWHRRAWRRQRRLTSLVLWLTASPGRTRRGLAGLRREPAALAGLLGINCGYWGFRRLSVRAWAALLTGR